jgi:hypothetical protein
MKESLSTLIHAPSKVGKSTLMSTAPPPVCVFDVEGSWKFIQTQGFQQTDRPLRKIAWDPRREPPPRYDGTWDAAMVAVTDWASLTSGYVHLQQSPHDFRSVICDSVTEAQRKLKTNLRGLEQMRIQDWGDLLVYMDKWIRDVRDLTLVPDLPIQFAGFVAETEMKNGKWRPAMQGQIGRALPYWVDLCGYLYTDTELDGNGQPTRKIKRLLIMSDHPEFESGERVQGLLGDVVTEPNFTDMMKKIYGDTVFEKRETSK